jgi:HSP20 family molecular chaperone IbpA
MSRLFNSPFLLGFDQLERALDRVAKGAGEAYPPYNIEQIGDAALRITLAVAGFSRDDLSVTLEDRQLIVSGRQRTEGAPRTYLHRGIAARQFQRSFLLAEGIEVTGAELANGLLHVDLARPEPPRKRQSIAIRDGEEESEARARTIEVAARKVVGS